SILDTPPASPPIYTLSLHDALPILRTVGAAADGNLVHDGCAVDQPADRPHIRPGERRVVEDAGIPRGAREQLLDHLRPRDAERLDRKSTRLNSSHQIISSAVFCLKK